MAAVSFSAILSRVRRAYPSLGDHVGLGEVLQHLELPGKARGNVYALARADFFKPAQRVVHAAAARQHSEQLALDLSHGNAPAARLAAPHAAVHLSGGQGGIHPVPSFAQRIAVHQAIGLGVVSFRRASGLDGELDQALYGCVHGGIVPSDTAETTRKPGFGLLFGRLFKDRPAYA